jgi:hypothetical protein
MARGRPRKDREDVFLKSAEFIGWALGGLEREIAQTRERLSSLTAQAAKLRARVGQTSSRAAMPAEASTAGAIGEGASRRRRRRNMSPEARKRISEMMKKRWAEYRKTKKNV